MHKIEDPSNLKPSSRPTWRYTEPGLDLATAGIYSQKDMEGLKRQIMFPSERTAITNTLVRKIISNNADTQSLDFGNLIDKNTISSLFYTTWNKAWSTVSIFGEVVSGLMGCWLIAKIIKFVIDTAIHAYSLTIVFGFGWRLLGMFWDALTFCLIHHHQENTRVQRMGGDLEEIVVVSDPPVPSPAPVAAPLPSAPSIVASIYPVIHFGKSFYFLI